MAPLFPRRWRRPKSCPLPPPDEPGQYFCGVTRWDTPTTSKARGGKILILRGGSADS